MPVDLHVSSAFSFLRAASLPETLVERAAALGYSSVALLDRDGVYGAPRFHKAATAAGIKPLIGAELTMAWGERRGSAPLNPWVLSLLVASQAGWRNLCRLVTCMKLRAPKGEGALTLEDLEELSDGLVVLAGRPVLQANRFGVGGLLDRLIGIFGRDNVFVELQRHLRRDQEEDNDTLACVAEAFRVPLIATGGTRFATPDERPLFDVLTCIREHATLAQAGRRLAANAECYLRPPAQMARLFADHPEAMRTAEALAERLTFSMTDLGYRFPRYPTPPGETAIAFLRKIVEVGARDRYRPYHDAARAQIARELDLIEKLDLAGYFLIVWDIVNYCRQQDILVQGRGSAANSAVCYSLGITAVDPVKMELLFERFLSEERGEWPDIDLDLPSGDRREQVIQHVFQKHGKHGAAMTANVITYRGRSAAREVGKALALDAEQIDSLAKVMHQFEFVDPGETLSRNMAAVGMAAGDPRVGLFARLWRQMQDLPRHLGQHSGGMVIATVISSGDNESHAHPRPDALGVYGKCGRGDRPLIFSTELARSTKENIKDPHKLREDVTALFADLAAATTNAERAAAQTTIDARLAKLERSVAVYGLINLRTDGHKVLLAQKLERPRSSTHEEFDVHLLEPDATGELTYVIE